jgi:hypothetical protein
VVDKIATSQFKYLGEEGNKILLNKAYENSNIGMIPISSIWQTPK